MPNATGTHYHATCRGCGRTYTVVRDESDPKETTTKGYRTRCRRCGTTNWAIPHADDGPRLPADYGPAWVLDWGDCACVFPQGDGGWWGGVDD